MPAISAPYLMGPLLDALRQLGGSGTPNEVGERVAKDVGLSDEIQNDDETRRYKTQMSWARQCLVLEGLLDRSQRGVWSLTERGRATKLTAEQSSELFRQWSRHFQDKRHEKKSRSEPVLQQVTETPETISDDDHSSEVIKLLLNLPPSGFERFAQRLLREAGFNQVEVTGRSGDGGIDGYGTLHVNPLVSFKVLFQCKRYTNSVAPSQVRDFRGAMAGRADKGIIITTGEFTAEARREASRVVPPVELIDGDKLVELLERLELGLKPKKTYEVDKSFFEGFKS